MAQQTKYLAVKIIAVCALCLSVIVGLGLLIENYFGG
jgi:hypothetical protein